MSDKTKNLLSSLIFNIAQIQAQQNEINSLRLAASQERQNSYLIDQLKPCPIPAYITCNPYQSYGFTYPNNCCGCNTGC